jgi:hypothetical protein
MNAPSLEARLALPDVTLLAVTSVNIAATLAALEKSMTGITFGAVKLLTNRNPGSLPPGLEHVAISPLESTRAYSNFVLRELAAHVTTSHVLLVQWDGHVIDARRWRAEFLDYDYLGASWPQFGDGFDVGNGGFSLRSRALLEWCRDPAFNPSHPEDLAIGRHNRALLEANGMRFASRELADAFSAERAGSPDASFGYHGVWHMPRLLGHEEFWQVYRGLDERTSVRHDFGNLMWQLAAGRGGAGRALSLLADRLYDPLWRRQQHRG